MEPVKVQPWHFLWGHHTWSDDYFSWGFFSNHGTNLVCLRHVHTKGEALTREDINLLVDSWVSLTTETILIIFKCVGAVLLFFNKYKFYFIWCLGHGRAAQCARNHLDANARSTLHEAAKKELIRAINQSKARCWWELCDIDNNPLWVGYKIVTQKLGGHSLLPVLDRLNQMWRVTVRRRPWPFQHDQSPEVKSGPMDFGWQSCSPPQRDCYWHLHWVSANIWFYSGLLLERAPA